MKPDEEVRQALLAIFPGCGVHVINFAAERWQQAIVFDNDDRCGVNFRFEHMPKIAEAFGTECLDFSAIQSADHMDSVTYDGSLLIIQARFVDS